MAHRIPSFNNVAHYWDDDANYGFAAPTIASLECQLRAPNNVFTGQDQPHAWVFLWSLLVPAGTDIRDWSQNWEGGIIECPAGSGRIYSVKHVDDVAKGFPNEYRVVMMTKTTNGDANPWPIPMP